MAVRTRAALKAQAQGTDFQDQVNDLVDSVAAGAQAAAIADATAITGGESPTEAEHNAALTKLNSILAALRTFGIIAP